MTPSLMILAAGIGKRYGGLKQVDRFGPSGETFVDYSVFDAIRAGFEKAVFIISKDIENDFKESVTKKFQGKIDVHFAFQATDDIPPGIRVPPDRDKPWGTTHAVLAAASKIKEPFAVLNADDFYGANSFKVIFTYLSSLPRGDEATYCIVGFRLSTTLSEHGHVARAVCRLDQGDCLKSIVERTHILKSGDKIIYQDERGRLIKIKGDPVVSMNMMGFTPSVFPHFKFYFKEFIQKHSQDLKAELYMPNVLNEIIKEKKARVKILMTDESWFGVTYKEDRALAVKRIRALINRGVYPRDLWG